MVLSYMYKSNDAVPKKKKLLKEIYELIKIGRYRINPEENHYISILQWKLKNIPGGNFKRHKLMEIFC